MPGSPPVLSLVLSLSKGLVEGPRRMKTLVVTTLVVLWQTND